MFISRVPSYGVEGQDAGYLEKMINVECARYSSSPWVRVGRKQKAGNLRVAKCRAPTMPKRREVLNGKKVRKERRGRQGLQSKKNEGKTKKTPGIKGGRARQGGFRQRNLN